MAAHGVHSYLPGDPDTAMAAPCRSWLIINFYIRRNNWNESSDVSPERWPLGVRLYGRGNQLALRAAKALLARRSM